MGARVYIPSLGRFLQVDPVEGGTDNNYVYANDPVNEFDLNGEFIPVVFLVANVARIAAPYVARAAVSFVAKQAVPFVAKKAVPFLAKKAIPQMAKWGTRVASRTVNIAKSSPEKLFGYTSKLYGNPTIRNSSGQNAARSGFFNQKWLPVRTGWSVGPNKANIMKPVFRTSIGYGKKAPHINWKYGRFY